MAFRSTRAFPNNSVDNVFADKGVAFGRDINATTSLLATQFRLDLPVVGDGDLARGLKWLRNVADGMVFDAEGLDSERGVVLAEKEARNTPQNLAEDALTRFQAPTARSTLRSPIGLEATLRAATPSTLEAFYRRWYRPDNAVVVIVGDRPVADLEADVKATFAGWVRPAAPLQPAPRLAPDTARGLEFFGSDQSGPLSFDKACRITSPRLPRQDTLGALRADALGDIWREALNQRLLGLRDSAANRLLGATATTQDNGADLRTTCLIVAPAGGDWAPGLRAAEGELKRFAATGPTDQELDQAIDNVRSHLRGDITAAPNRTASALANAILKAELDGEPLPEPRQALRNFDLAVEGVTADDVHAAFQRDWRGAGPLISVQSPSPPTAEALKAAWLAADAGAPLPTYADAKAIVWGYDFGAPGAVISRRHVTLGDFEVIQFSNGVRLNFKRTAFSRQSAALFVRFGAGRREIDNDDYQIAVAGAYLLNLGGVGKHSYADLHRLFQGDQAIFTLKVGEDGYYIGKDVTLPNLRDQLAVLAAYMDDPGFRPSVDPGLREAINIAYRMADSDPQVAAMNALFAAVAPGSVQALPPRSAFDRMDNALVAKLLKPSITNDPIEITLVGDIEEKTAVDMVAATFAALPPRRTPVQTRSDTAYVRFPAAPPAPITVTDKGPPDKAVAELVWPLYVATPERRREEYEINLLAAIFSDQLRQRVRVDLGKSYDPRVTTAMPDKADQGYMDAVVESYPADVDLMVPEMRAVAGRLRDGQFTTAQLDAARAPALALDRQRMSTNMHWAAALSSYGESDVGLKESLGASDLIASIRLEEVKKAAADWLTPAPIVLTVRPAAPEAGSAP